MPCVTKWPKPDRASLEAFYGRFQLGSDGRPTAQWQGNFLTQIQLPYPMRFSWDYDVVVKRLTCHKEVAPSLQRILGAIWAHYGQDLKEIAKARMDRYGGCYNFRPVRGGHTLSMHAYGAAIDLDPERNGLGKPWKPNSGMMPEAVIDLFKNESWYWGGDFKRPDSMHFESVDRS